MIKVLKRPYDDKNITLRVGTHNGIFHCDEMIAICLINIIFNNIKDIEVIRSRNLKLLNKYTHLLIDIGGGKYDHHQIGGNGERKNGIKYASSGLVWKDFGKDIIKLLSEEKLNEETIDYLHNVIDYEIIQNIDKEDNGQSQTIHQFQFIKNYLPEWYEENPDYDNSFQECANISSNILKRVIKSYISKELAKNEIKNRLNNPKFHIDDILIISNQTIPWLESILEYNSNCIDQVNFVVFPYPDGGYAIQCIPPSMNDTFSQLIPLPENWAGEAENLPSISGIPSAILCHQGRFFARAYDFDDILKMAKIAKDEYANTRKRKKSENK